MNMFVLFGVFFFLNSVLLSLQTAGYLQGLAGVPSVHRHLPIKKLVPCDTSNLRAMDSDVHALEDIDLLVFETCLSMK